VPDHADHTQLINFSENVRIGATNEIIYSPS